MVDNPNIRLRNQLRYDLSEAQSFLDCALKRLDSAMKKQSYLADPQKDTRNIINAAKKIQAASERLFWAQLSLEPDRED